MLEILEEVIDINELQDLMGCFYEAVGVPLGILDNEQNWLMTFGFQPICNHFHRLNPASRKECRETIKQVCCQLESGKYISRTCAQGLELVMFPIELNDCRLGSLFLGQFLHAPADLDFFRRQAANYSYDLPEYLAAAQKIPVISKERVDFLMQFLMRFLRLLVRVGDENRQRRNAEQEIRFASRQLKVEAEERTQELNTALTDVGDLAVQLNSQLHQVEQMALTDTLTETFNRRKFDEVVVLEQQLVLGGKLPFSVIMLDIDRFKRINDRYGHSVGDQVLKHLCNVLRDLIRQGDMLIRWGGEEFLILLPATELDEAGPLAKRIRKKVKQEVFPHHEQVTLSLGVAQLRSEDSIDSLIRRVDQALYLAKQWGRDRVKIES